MEPTHRLFPILLLVLGYKIFIRLPLHKRPRQVHPHRTLPRRFRHRVYQQPVCPHHHRLRQVRHITLLRRNEVPFRLKNRKVDQARLVCPNAGQHPFHIRVPHIDRFLAGDRPSQLTEHLRKHLLQTLRIRTAIVDRRRCRHP